MNITTSIIQFGLEISPVRLLYQLYWHRSGKAKSGPQANATSFDDGPTTEIIDKLSHFVGVQQ